MLSLALSLFRRSIVPSGGAGGGAPAYLDLNFAAGSYTENGSAIALADRFEADNDENSWTNAAGEFNVVSGQGWRSDNQNADTSRQGGRIPTPAWVNSDLLITATLNAGFTPEEGFTPQFGCEIALFNTSGAWDYVDLTLRSAASFSELGTTAGDIPGLTQIASGQSKFAILVKGGNAYVAINGTLSGPISVGNLAPFSYFTMYLYGAMNDGGAGDAWLYMPRLTVADGSLVDPASLAALTAVEGGGVVNISAG